MFCEECGNRLAKVAPPTPLVAAPATARCGVCGTVNPAGDRYCMDCGQPLAQPAPNYAAAPPAPAPQPYAAPQAAPAPGAQALAQALAETAQAPPQPTPVAQVPARPVPVAQAPLPVPVVVARAHEPTHAAQVHAAASPPVAAHAVVAVVASTEAPPSLVCQRCRGANQAASLFCRYCGASLAQLSTPAEPAAAPTPSSAGAPATAAPLAPVAVVPVPPAPPAPPPPAAPVAVVPVPPPPPPAPAASAGRVRPSTAPAPLLGAARGSSPPRAPARASNPPVTPSVAPSTERESISRGVGAHSLGKPRGHLVVITKDGTAGASYPLGEQVDIGRSEGEIVIHDDPYLSPRHARVVFRGNRAHIRDLNSVNGLFLRISAVRGRPVGEIERAPVAVGAPPSAVASVDTNIAMPLQDQDLILIGQQVLRFEALRDAEAGLGPASEHGTLLFGTPTAPRYARLNQRTVEGVTRDVYYIRKVETVLGRESGDVVFTDDPFLSRRHAAFLVLPTSTDRKRSSVHIVDLGSSNGTFLAVREETMLYNGDLVRMGQQLFRVDLEGAHD